MIEQVEIRHLTRKEQLEYLIKFLEDQKKQNEIDLISAKSEYQLLLQKKDDSYVKK